MSRDGASLLCADARRGCTGSVWVAGEGAAFHCAVLGISSGKVGMGYVFKRVCVRKWLSGMGMCKRGKM